MNSSSDRIGYARVSTADQNLDAQIAALQGAGCTMIRTETGDGATLAGRLSTAAKAAGRGIWPGDVVAPSGEPKSVGSK